MSIAHFTEESAKPSAGLNLASLLAPSGETTLPIYPWLNRIGTILHQIAFRIPEPRRVNRSADVGIEQVRTSTLASLFKELQRGTRNARIYQVAGSYEVHLYDAADDYQDRQTMDCEQSALHTAYTWCR